MTIPKDEKNIFQIGLKPPVTDVEAQPPWNFRDWKRSHAVGLPEVVTTCSG